MKRIVGLLFAVVSLAVSAHAATITVNTLLDEDNTNGSACSLREAINNANTDNTSQGLGCVAGSGDDTIVITASGTIHLTAELPLVETPITISKSTGPSFLTIDGSGAGTIQLLTNESTLSINGITFANANLPTGGGGAISTQGALTIQNCVFANNSAEFGGAIENASGSLNISNSTFTGNSADQEGGAIDADFGNNLIVTNSVFNGNHASGGCGAVRSPGTGTTTISNSTFIGNSSMASPGGLEVPNTGTVSGTAFINNSTNGAGGGIVADGHLTLINSTLSGNFANGGGGGIEVEGAGTANITNSTICGNRSNAGGGILRSGGTVTLLNSIVAGNTNAAGSAQNDLGGTISGSSSFNLIGTGGSGGLTNGVNANQVGVANPRLLPLGNYGGTVQTIPIRPNSPARNAGTNTGAPAADARGFSRPQEATVDIGAFELQANSIVANTANSGTGSLRNVVAAVASGDVVQFASPLFDSAQTISLSAGQIAINGDVTIYGNGANLLTVRNTAAQSSTSRLFNVAGGITVSLTGLALTGGNVVGNGGAINHDAGTLVVANCEIDGNVASNDGGGIKSVGTLTVSGSTLANNTANNPGGNKGGGIDFSGSLLNIISSTISGNTSMGGTNNAGGVWSNNVTNINNSTITNNLADGAGSAGAIFKAGVPPATISDSIIAGDQNNSTVPDVTGVGTYVSNGYNLIGNTGTVTSFQKIGDQTGSGSFAGDLTRDAQDLVATGVLDPKLGPLALNGHATATHVPLFSSPAVDKGNSFGLTTDQDGLNRVVDFASLANAAGGDGTDIGAVELQFQPTAAGASVSGRVFDPEGAALGGVQVSFTDTQGVVRAVLTNGFGYYEFDDVPSGHTYVFSLAQKRHTFAPQLIDVSGDMAGLNFAALE